MVLRRLKQLKDRLTRKRRFEQFSAASFEMRELCEMGKTAIDSGTDIFSGAIVLEEDRVTSIPLAPYSCLRRGHEVLGKVDVARERRQVSIGGRPAMLSVLHVRAHFGSRGKRTNLLTESEIEAIRNEIRTIVSSNLPGAQVGDRYASGRFRETRDIRMNEHVYQGEGVANFDVFYGGSLQANLGVTCHPDSEFRDFARRALERYKAIIDGIGGLF